MEKISIEDLNTVNLSWEVRCPTCNTIWTDGTYPQYFCPKCFPILKEIIQERMNEKEEL